VAEPPASPRSPASPGLPEFDYDNVTGRQSAPLVVALARVLPGVAAVQSQHRPYASAWRAANLEALARPGPRWIVFGDSMSLGVGASRFDAGWVNQVHDELGAAGHRYEIVNLSANGARASDVLEQQVPAWRSLPPAPGPAGGRDLVTLLIGSNDLLSRTHRERLPAVFSRLLDQLPDGSVIATLPQPRAAARAVNEIITAAQARRDLTVVDMRASGPKSWRGRLADDHFHPNDAGYRGIADAFIGPIRTSIGLIDPV
jgi:lysophospholipase L1-like esterase